MKTKILYVATVPNMHSYSLRIIEIMMKSKESDCYAVFFLENSYNDGRDNYKDLLEHNLSVRNKIFFKFFPKNKIFKNIFSVRYSLSIKKIAAEIKADIIHLITQDVLLAPYLYIFKRYTLIYTVHDLIHHEADHGLIKKVLNNFLLIQRDKILIKKINNLITSSPHQYKQLINLYPAKNIFFHDMPDLITKQIKEGQEIVKEAQDQKSYILFFGRIEKYKGIELLYKIFTENEQLSGQTLIIAGSGRIYFKRDLSKEKSIIFINRFIRDSELNDLFKKAYCLVLPYISSTQSAVTSLAYHYQLPVIASDINGLNNTIINRVTGLLFANGDPGDLAEKLISIIREKALYKTIVFGQKEQKLKFFNEKNIRTEIDSIYSTQTIT